MNEVQCSCSIKRLWKHLWKLSQSAISDLVPAVIGKSFSIAVM